MGWRNRAVALVGVVALATGVGLPLVATQAGATSPPSQLNPADGSTVMRPQMVTATYGNTTLDPRSDQSFITVSHAGGAEVAGTSSTAGPQSTGNTIVWKPTDPNSLTDGTYNA